MSTHALSSGDLTADRRADYARMLGEGGDPGAAAELMEQALDLVPGWAAGWFRLGEYRQKAGLAGAADAYRRALACDSVSAFGGIIALNQMLDAEAAEEIVKLFTEVIVAPSVTDEAKAIVARKPNLRLLVTGGLADPRDRGLSARTVSGGLLVQTRDNGMVDDLDLRVVTKRAPSSQELEDMKFAFKVAKHVKSNAVVYAKDGQTAGIGAGQMRRVDSARIAAIKAEEAARAAGWPQPLTKGSAVASEAFLPFADGLLSAIAAGATAVIQPGGSMRDEEVIAAADANDVAMVFIGMRHFRH